MSVPDGVTIRRGVPADADALTHLHLDCWDDAYTGLMPQEVLDARRTNVAERVDRWRGILARSRNTLVAEAAGGLVGFVSAGPGRDQDMDIARELWALYVRASWWGTGTGRALLDTALGDDPAYLWVLAGNDRAARFYERQGFRPDGSALDEPEGRHLRMVRR